MISKILICGNIAGCGKSTVARYLEEKYGFKELYFAEGIYEIAYKYFGMANKERKLLIDIGQKMREINPDIWVDYTMHRSQQYEISCISDCRQENEYYQSVVNGFLPIRIVANRNIAINRIIKRDGKCDVDLLDSAGEIGTRHIPMIEINNDKDIEHLHRQLDDLLKVDWKPYIRELRCGIMEQANSYYNIK